MQPSIITSTNPDNRKNWFITVEITTPVNINVRMAPDKLVAEHSSIKSYLNSKLVQKWVSPEEMVLEIIEELNNELVPKWIEVIYMHEGIKIEIQDRQPGMSGFGAPEK